MSGLLSMEFWVFAGVLAGIYAIFSLGLQVQFGFAGLVNFGHVASLGIASYTMAILVVKAGVPLGIACAVAIVSAVAFSLVITLPSLRLAGDYLAITTLAFAEIIRYVPLNENSLGGAAGSIGLNGLGQAAYYDGSWNALLVHLQNPLGNVLGSSFATRDFSMLVVVWVVVGLVAGLFALAVRSPWGRTLRAVRDDPEAATALGKSLLRCRMQAMALGAVAAGVAGVLFALQYSFFSPDDFQPQITFYAWMIIIMAGGGRLLGVIPASLFFGFVYAGTRFLDFFPLSELNGAQRSYLRLLIIGLVFLLLMVFRPQGLFGSRREMHLE